MTAEHPECLSHHMSFSDATLNLRTVLGGTAAAHVTGRGAQVFRRARRDPGGRARMAGEM
ncbi:hypothetical protein GCM10009843_18600 [Nocardioides bigeumensis]|uniref:Uncharacterized protein n=1 Tax=Nocardioides bigeumensis TaxID=433657 RepID=A0ABP5JWT4_9ACTN